MPSPWRIVFIFLKDTVSVVALNKSLGKAEPDLNDDSDAQTKKSTKGTQIETKTDVEVLVIEPTKNNMQTQTKRNPIQHRRYEDNIPTNRSLLRTKL